MKTRLNPAGNKMPIQLRIRIARSGRPAAGMKSAVTIRRLTGFPFRSRAACFFSHRHAALRAGRSLLVSFDGEEAGQSGFFVYIDVFNGEKPMSKQLEEGLKLELDWNKLEKAVAGTKGIIPVAVQNADTREVILVAYINQLAFEESLKRKMLVLWSSSRQELWVKGLTSGETFELIEARVNCEQNSLLFIVRPNRGGICHTKNKDGQPRDCYYRKINFETLGLENIDP
jgi:phosphoribosyl-AMP cyclohydrolase